MQNKCKPDILIKVTFHKDRLEADLAYDVVEDNMRDFDKAECKNNKTMRAQGTGEEKAGRVGGWRWMCASS